MTRPEIQAEFARRFSFPPRKPTSPITAAELQQIEKSLETVFPTSYISFIISHGALFTPDIFNLMVAAHEAGMPSREGFDVYKFLVPTEIPETHQLYVSGGMDDGMIPFAMDSCGNLFGFPKARSNPRADESQILFFDHDYCKVLSEAPSFDSWLQSFLVLK